MKLFIVGLWCSCFLSVLGQLTLFPERKTIVYQWEAEIHSGTILPTPLKSSWTYNALLTVKQLSENTTFFKITEIETNNGLKGTSSLELPFYVTYNNGELELMEVSPEDETWSLNMKRSLASLLQLKLEKVMFSVVLTEQENGIYGKCNVEYSLNKLSEKMFHLRKSIDHDSCQNSFSEHYANTPDLTCPSSYHKMMVSHSERDYTLSPYEPILIQNVSSQGRILFQPFEARAEAHYARISQLIKFKYISEMDQIVDKDPDYIAVEVAYENPDLDPTYGKQPENRTEMISEIYNLLGELGDSLSSWEVGVKGLDNKTSFLILDLMWWLDVDDWQKLLTNVSLGTSYRQETIQHLFWDLVPQVGSESALLFIKDLVTKSTTKTYMPSRIARILVNFPFYLKQASEELLTKCEDLLKLDDSVAVEVRQSAILGFASLINKICNSNCKPDTLDRYAKLYLDKFTSSATYEYKMLYLQGLSNIDLGHVLDYLTPVITGKISSDKNIRFLAAWTTLSNIHNNPNKVYDVYWPIFSNKSETLELRTAALTIILMSNPSTSKFLSIYWFMKGEPSEQLYNFYYTTIHSLAKSNFPCYLQIAAAASKIARFVPAKSRIWATGNYLLDFEDSDRAYGGLLRILLIASEQTGLPNVFMFTIEQHSLGHSRHIELYLKVGGLAMQLCNEFDKIARIPHDDETISKVVKLLSSLKVPLKEPEDLHLEIILKIDSKTVISQYVNKTTFTNLSEAVKKLSSVYFEFSVNYQALTFPTLISMSYLSDMGTPALMQIRSVALISSRGSVSQEKEGRVRNAEIDLRYSWNGVTVLKTYNPLENEWHGAERSRNLHIRLPIATQLNLEMEKSAFKVTAVSHKDFVTGTRLGLVWHASSRLFSRTPVIKMYPDISDEWTLDSEDLGARLGASVFDCPHPDTIPDALQLLKKAFLANHKNYNMVPGGVVLLGLLSLNHQLHFQPQGNNCGVMLYFTPLLSQVEPVLYVEGGNIKLSINRRDGLLWEIQAGSKRLNDGNKEFSYKLYRAPSVSVTVAHIWRVIQLEGAFIVPSRMSGVFHPPTPLTGYTFVSWGDATPSQTDKAAMLDLKILPGGTNDTGGVYCEGFDPGCLQAGSDLAARQTATLQYANLPTWLKMAAHALFPEHIQTESSRTQVTFDYPVALLPWNTKGLCALNAETVLTLDNSTLVSSLPSCYSLAVADCSKNQTFSIEGARFFNCFHEIEMIPHDDEMQINFNGVKVENVTTGFRQSVNDTLEMRMRNGIFEIELRSGVVLQHYNKTVVILVPAVFRGYTCGLCGNFNGDTNNEPSILYSSCNTAKV